MALLDTSLKSLTSWMHIHPHYSGIIIFFIAFCESLAIIGSIIPGSVAMTAVGILAGSGVIRLSTTLFYASVGAIAGDGVSYWFGSYFQQGLKNIWPFWKYPVIFQKGQEFFDKHGGKSIILGRFIGPMRSMIPMIAGMLNLPPLRFMMAAIIASILWSILYTLPGILIGAATIDLSSKQATYLIIIILISLIVLWLISGLFKLTAAWILRILNKNINNFWAWMRQHPQLQKFAVFISAPQHPQSYAQLGLCLMLICSALLFLSLCLSVNHTLLIPHINNAVFYTLQSFRAPHLDEVMVAITFFGERYVLLTVWLVILGWLIYQRHWRTLMHVLITGILAIIAIVLIKHAVNFSRPQEINVIRKSHSFPSGHITLSITILGFLAYLIASMFNRIVRRIIYAPFILLLGLIALSRIYLGAHWFSDLVGSVFLALVILLISVISYRRASIPKLAVKPLIAIFLLSYIASWGIFYHNNFDAALYAYTPKYIITRLDYQDWWSRTSKIKLPLYRSNRLGEVSSLFNVQWAAPLAQIKNFLIFHGWQEVHPGSMINLINRITQNNTTQHLPVLAPLYNNQKPVLSMIKTMGNDKPPVILNLWKSYYHFRDQDTPLWLGSVTYLVIWHPWHSPAANALMLQMLPPPITYLNNTFPTFKVKSRKLETNAIVMKDMLVQYHPTILLISAVK